MKVSRIFRSIPVVLLGIISMIVAGLIYQDYGDGFDDIGLREYGYQSLNAYKNFPNANYDFQFVGYEMQYYGPAYVTGVELFLRVFHLPIDVQKPGDYWHLAYFISFMVGVVSLNSIARRWLSEWSAFGITILFLTQPLIWGHAFINAKDIPFMGFFLFSVAVGLWMEDKVKPPDHEINWMKLIKQSWERIRQNYLRQSGIWKKRAGLITLFLTLIIAVLIIGKDLWAYLIVLLVKKIYTAGPHQLLGRIFLKFAHNSSSIPVENYIHKAQVLFSTVEIPFILIAVIGILLIYRVSLPWTIRVPSLMSIFSFIKEMGKALTKPQVIIAGVVLGLTTSIRVLGPLAGVIICLIIFFKKGKNALATIFAYALITLVITYFTWPYLWSDPFHNFFESITVMNQFPWIGKVLFNSKRYSPSSLPWFYIPELMSIQFTEPLIILFVVGFGISINKAIRHQNSLLGFSLLWLFLPVTYLIVTRRPIYDNFRQLFFLVPPVFLLSGYALDAILQFAKKYWMKIIILSLVVFPGIYWCCILHPYEYSYYNGLVGNLKGANGRFETDYWMTSFRAATNFLNNIAPPNSKVIVWNGVQLVRTYAREDFTIDAPHQANFNLVGGYEFAVMSSRGSNDKIYPDAIPVFIVQKDGALFAVVKRLSATSSP